MDMTHRQVEHLSGLARLSLTPQEREEVAGRLELLLTHMEMLAQAEQGAEGGQQEPGMLRCDRAEPSPIGDKLLTQAPQVRENYVVTPGSVGEGGEG